MHAGNLLNEPFPFHTRATIIYHWYPLGFYIEDHENIISALMSFETRLFLQTWAKYRVTEQNKRAEEQCRAPRRMCCAPCRQLFSSHGPKGRLKYSILQNLSRTEIHQRLPYWKSPKNNMIGVRSSHKIQQEISQLMPNWPSTQTRGKWVLKASPALLNCISAEACCNKILKTHQKMIIRISYPFYMVTD